MKTFLWTIKVVKYRANVRCSSFKLFGGKNILLSRFWINLRLICWSDIYWLDNEILFHLSNLFKIRLSWLPSNNWKVISFFLQVLWRSVCNGTGVKWVTKWKKTFQNSNQVQNFNFSIISYLFVLWIRLLLRRSIVSFKM